MELSKNFTSDYFIVSLDVRFMQYNILVYYYDCYMPYDILTIIIYIFYVAYCLVAERNGGGNEILS